MFIHNFDTLVTKDYLDVRFSDFEARLLSKVDKLLNERFSAVDNRFSAIDKRLNAIDIRFAEMDGKLGQQQVMLGVIMAGLSIPIIQTLITWLA